MKSDMGVQIRTYVDHVLVSLPDPLSVVDEFGVSDEKSVVREPGRPLSRSPRLTSGPLLLVGMFLVVMLIGVAAWVAGNGRIPGDTDPPGGIGVSFGVTTANSGTPSCSEPGFRGLAGSDVAFEAVVSKAGNPVVLSITRLYQDPFPILGFQVGLGHSVSMHGPSDPAGVREDEAPLIEGAAPKLGQHYLISATWGLVERSGGVFKLNECGLSGPATNDLRSQYEAVFGQ